MKIWVYSLCWNEKMFLPFYLKHYSSFANKIIIYDHHSDDGSRELASENKKVEIRDYNAPGIHEPSVTNLYNTCYQEARGKADWVILCDIDEIVYDPYLLSTLQEYQDICVTVPRTIGYTMLHDSPPKKSRHQIWHTHKFGVEDCVFNKYAIFNPQVNITFDPGRHAAKFNPEPIFSPPKIKLLHYRYWGKEWIKKRNKIHFARLSEENIKNSWGYHLWPERDNGEYYTPKWFDRQMENRREVV